MHSGSLNGNMAATLSMHQSRSPQTCLRRRENGDASECGMPRHSVPFTDNDPSEVTSSSPAHNTPAAWLPQGCGQLASSTHAPKREELSLREVLALPKASSSGLDSSTCAPTGTVEALQLKANGPTNEPSDTWERAA